MKILIIEDDENILSLLERGLNEEGHVIQSAIDGEDGEYLATENNYDIIILDWMLPNKNGLTILENIRKKSITTPVLMLTAKSEIIDKVKGLKSGADDYLAKPFDYEELLARIEALYRRGVSKGINIIEISNITIDIDKKIVAKDTIPLQLTSKEYDLFLFLIKNKNSMISNSMIEEQLWNENEFINSNVIQVTMYNLKKKIGKDIIKNFRGLGYKLDV
ncbi:response regulator transcription factor [Arcobacter sp. KX21116]|jgi:DNA-binding response OmpR family regulator|uniref:response regulator transcription factor n=1 Tax=Arcobacter iocasae TaxID=2906515 RepID=UPI0035D4CC74|tara:strand:+ start:127012 stop:127668 length:657 start_codon:yes stop_codon:yes gene_type:complete